MSEPLLQPMPSRMLTQDESRRRRERNDRWQRLWWNPIWKYNRRMMPATLSRKINPEICGKMELFNAAKMFSVLGWGFLWGFELEWKTNNRGERFKAPKLTQNRNPGDPIAVKGWRFGRIRVTIRP